MRFTVIESQATTTQEATFTVSLCGLQTTTPPKKMTFSWYLIGVYLHGDTDSCPLSGMSDVKWPGCLFKDHAGNFYAPCQHNDTVSCQCLGSLCCSKLQENGNVDTLEHNSATTVYSSHTGRTLGRTGYGPAGTELGTERWSYRAEGNWCCQWFMCTKGLRSRGPAEGQRCHPRVWAGTGRKVVFSPFYQLKQQATLLRSLLPICWPQQWKSLCQTVMFWCHVSGECVIGGDWAQNDGRVLQQCSSNP